MSRKHGIKTAEAIKYLANLYYLDEVTQTKEKRFSFIYKNKKGDELFKKIKIVGQHGDKGYSWMHKKDGEWIATSGKIDPILYNLDKFKDCMELIICEGERDADNLNALGLSALATTAPFGAGSWNDSLTKCLEDIPVIYFCYDLGNEEYVHGHADKIKKAYPDVDLKIINVPGEVRDDDITDYLETILPKERTDAFLELMGKAEKFSQEKLIEAKEFREKPLTIFTGTLKEFTLEYIPEPEYLAEPYLFRGGLTEIGGIKGSHKSFFVMQLGLCLASGQGPFLTSEIGSPVKVMLIQQEVSLGFMKKRLEKVRMSTLYPNIVQDNFLPFTTTGHPLNLLDKEDFDTICSWIERYRPDVLALDPLYTFHTKGENLSAMSDVMGIVNGLKSNYNLAILLVHHFSSKIHPDDPLAPQTAGAWFRGHSSIADAADVLICLHRLPGQKMNPNLPLPYDCYNYIEIELRDGQRPEKFASEFNPETFLITKSTIWEDIGKHIMPGEVLAFIKDSGGEALQKNIIQHFARTGTSAKTVKIAIGEEEKRGHLNQERLGGRGNPLLFRIKK